MARTSYKTLALADLEMADGTCERVAPDPEGQKGSGLTKECKEVPEVQGIPVPKQPWFRCDRLVHTLIACLLIGSPWIRRQGLKEKHFLPANEISIEVSNCQVTVQDGAQPGVLVQRWFFMGTVEERRSNDGHALRVVATMRPRLSSWFRCQVVVVAPEANHTSSVNALNVTVSNSERPAAVLLSGGFVRGRIGIYGKSAAVVNATGTKSSNEIMIQSREQGLVQLHLGRSSASQWRLRGTSPVFVESTVPVKLRATGLGRVRAPEIREDSGSFDLCSESVRAKDSAYGLDSSSSTAVERRLEPVDGNGEFNCSAVESIDFEQEGNSNIHVDLPCEKCKVKVGSIEMRLTASSKEALDDVLEFIQSRGEHVPWLVSFQIGGLNQSWVLASTTAFTYFDASWFAALSFGVLAPVTKHHFLTLEGDPSAEKEIDDVLKGSKSLVSADELDEACPSWKQTADVTKLLVEGLHLQNGVSLLAKASQCRSGLVFQKSKKGFTLDWNPTQCPFSIQIAILMNGCCAIALSILVMTVAKNHILPFLYNRLSKAQAHLHASQRLQVGLVEETDISVTFSHYPERGLHLSWSKAGQGASRYVIKMKSSHSEARILVNAAEVDTQSTTVSFFLSLERAALHYAKEVLSISVITISHSQEVGCTSWSSPVRIEPLWTTAHLPFKVLTVLFPKRQDKGSLSTFLQTACGEFTPPALTLVLEKLHVICDEGRVAADFRMELFFGSALEASRQATNKGKEESFAQSTNVTISDWFSSKPRADGWTADDAFGVDICPEKPLRLTPPFRDSMRSGATLVFQMVAQNDEVLASGVADWNDLLDAYPSRPGGGGAEFTFQADLVDASGESLGGLCFKPDFQSEQLESVGKKPLDPYRSSKVWFQEDVPGDVYQQGMDRFVVWDDADSDAVHDVHVDLYLEQVGKVAWQLMSDDVRFSSQTFPWVVDAEFSDSPYVCCRIIMVMHGRSLPTEPSWQDADLSRNVLCTSNWFFVVQTLPLRHLERAYGAFCRMNNLHMEGASEATLKAQGIQVRTVNVRGCSGIRRPLSFESAPEDLIKCSGGLLLASISHTILGASTDDRYRLRSYRIFLLEGLRLLGGNAHWCENHMLSAGFDASLYLQEMIHSPNLIFIIDFSFHVLMSAYQLLCFFAFSCLGLSFLQFLQSYRVEAAAFDVMQVSEMEAHSAEIGDLPFAAKLLFGCHMLISLLCVLVGNVMQDTPGAIPHFADYILGLMSTLTFIVSAFLLFVMLLFFFIGALLHPSSALKPLLVLGSCGAVVATMWMQFSSLTSGLLKVIEFQVDTVFDVMLQNMTGRIKEEQEDNVSSYDGNDLDFALEKANNRFQGLDAEGKPLKQSKDPLFRCIKPDLEMIKEVQDNISKTSLSKAGKSAAGEALTELEGEMSAEHLQQLAELYKHYLGKTRLDSSLEWRIFEETDALTDIMLREHNMRTQLLKFGAIGAEADKAPPQGSQASERTPLPKAYLMYKAIYRDSFDQLAGMIVKWADPFFQWTRIVQKVTSFFDDSVPKFICSCATASFDGNRKDSVAQKVLAKVAQHVEDTMHKDPAKTLKLNDLIAELQNPDGWASGLLYSETPGVYDQKQVAAFVREQVKQALPLLKSTTAIPVYKLVAVFEQLIKGRVWWSALVPFLKVECGFLDKEIDKEDLRHGFKRTSKGCGFMDYQDIPDVLMWMTDGGLWKSATVALLREIEVCGELGNDSLGTEDDEQSRVYDEWNPPTWPPWVLEYWREATDEEKNPSEGEAEFLQKSDVPSFINDLMLDTDPRHLTTGEALEPVLGFPEWKYKAMEGMQGCPAEVWKYVDDTHLARLRGIPWEAFDSLLEAFDLDMPEPASRKIFSGATQGGKSVGPPKFLEAPDLMRIIEKIQTQYQPISLSGFQKLLKNAGVTLPKPVIASLFGQLDDITLKIGGAEEFVCEDLVSLNQLGKVVEQYLSGGMWLEAAYGVLQNDEIETSFAEVSKAFASIDSQERGILQPSGVIKLMMSLQRTGIAYDTFADMILKDMRFVVNDSQLRVLFNVVDRSGNGSISKTEFIEGFHALMRQLVPNIILNSLSVLPEQIVSHILKALAFLLLLFAFLFLSMDAMTPSSAANVDFMGGVQAAVAGMAALGVRVQSTNGMDMQSIKEAIAARLSELLPGVKLNSRK